MKIALTFVASLALAACSSGPADPGNTTTSGSAGTTGGAATTGGGSGPTTSSTGGSGGTTTGTSTTGGGPSSPACPANAYTCPAGSAMAGAVYPGAFASDCGASPGQTFPDVELAGGGILNFATTQTKDDMNNFTSGTVHMHDLFCSGFHYVFVDVSAVWCVHCNDEAAQIPNTSYHPGSLYQSWISAGGTVFSVLVQGTGSASANQTDLGNWINMYSTPYPMALDTYQEMVQFIGLAGWPENMIVDLTNMQVKVTVGGDDPNFYQTYCTILGIANCPHP